MEIGLQLYHGLNVSREAMMTLSRAAEEAGYASVWVSEHMVLPKDASSRYPYGEVTLSSSMEWSEAMVALGFLAAATERVRLGTSVVPMWLRHPLVMAKQAATVDVLSGGRLELGLGAGWLREEAEALSQATDHPGARLREAIGILRRAWSDEWVEHESRFWSFPPVAVRPYPPQGAELPIWIGGYGPYALETITAHAVGSMLGPFPIEKVMEVRNRLPDGKRIGASIVGLADTGASRTRALGLRDAGCDLIIVMPDHDLDLARRQVDWFASSVAPEL